jgi:hypothetical protein
VVLIFASNNGDPNGDRISMLLKSSTSPGSRLSLWAKQEHGRVDLEVALEEFNAIFHGAEFRKSTANMAKWLKQENGYIAKKKYIMMSQTEGVVHKACTLTALCPIGTAPFDYTYAML